MVIGVFQMLADASTAILTVIINPSHFCNYECVTTILLLTGTTTTET
jgi:hypothetical protein